jgi:hypothetical protein
VTVLATEGDGTFEADAETEQLLLRAIDQCNQGQTTPMTPLLAELRTRQLPKRPMRPDEPSRIIMIEIPRRADSWQPE